MKDVVTITKHEMAKICSDAVNTMIPDGNRSMSGVAKLLFFAGLIMSLMFNEDEEEQDDEENVSVNN